MNKSVYLATLLVRMKWSYSQIQPMVQVIKWSWILILLMKVASENNVLSAILKTHVYNYVCWCTYCSHKALVHMYVCIAMYAKLQVLIVLLESLTALLESIDLLS